MQPSEPFEYSFLQEDFQRNYHADIKTSQIVSLFTAISIFISCLGLLGLSAFAAQQRTKEIGIRKVLGASVASVTALVSKDFIKLIIVAMIIACPAAWYFMNQWLQNFAYRTTIAWWVFVVPGIIALLIAFITVSSQIIKVAIANPVKSLRTE